MDLTPPPPTGEKLAALIAPYSATDASGTTFGIAIDRALKGYRVRNKQWTRSFLYIYYDPNPKKPYHKGAIKLRTEHDLPGNDVWYPSQTDMLSNEWEEIPTPIS